MNIFVLDTDPERAALYHNDRHVVKMILESAQLLSTAHHFLDGERTASHRVPGILSATHVNHPCAIWARLSTENYAWLHTLMTALGEQYYRRYSRTHAYMRRAQGYDSSFCKSLWRTPLNLPTGARTPFAQAMPIPYRRADPVEAYRLYYFNEKLHIATWKAPATEPQWFKVMREKELVKLAAQNAFVGRLMGELK